jgi:pyridoxine 5'-phosphate synthase PdxJ
MTHENTGLLPAHLKGKLVRNCTKKAPENLCLTHDLTHEMTHAFGSSFSSEMSVLTQVVAKFKIEFSIHFDTLFHTAKKVCQIPARTLTLVAAVACSLDFDLFTAKSPPYEYPATNKQQRR